jgi:hypothetical protein
MPQAPVPAAIPWPQHEQANMIRRYVFWRIDACDERLRPIIDRANVS